MNIIYYKIKRLIDVRPTKGQHTTKEIVAYLAIWLFILIFLIWIIYITLYFVSSAIYGTDFAHQEILGNTALSMIFASILTIIFRAIIRQEANDHNSITLNAPAIEQDVFKTLPMEVVEKNANIGEHGETHRELLLKDETGRIIDYHNYGHHTNFNTVFFAVEQGQTYDFEWNMSTYDPTGKQNSYRKITKINGKDVDL